MVSAGGARRASGVLAGLMLLATAFAIPAAAQTSAAESIADKFSSDAAASQRRAEEQRKKDAEAKAMEALREQARKRAEDALKAERAKELKAHAGQPRTVQAPPPPAAAPLDPKAEEQEMLERARQEEAARHSPPAEAHSARTIEQIIAERAAKHDEAAAEAKARAKAVADARRAWQQSAQRIANAEKELADAQARAKAVADARRAWQQSAQRIASAEKEIAEAQARAEAERKAVAAVAPAPSPPASAATPTAAVATPRAAALPQRVTVLLIMQPGDKGIRRHNKSADPILCVNAGCYVSGGADAPAQFMPGRQALGLANTWGARAGACRNHLGCVFRGLAVDELPLLVQPIDMRVVKHDRRHMAAISSDSQCRLEAGRLACARGIIEDDYVMWVIPEPLAEAAGPALLEQTVNAGLTGPQSAHVEVKH